MLGRMDWDVFWKHELFRRQCDPLDFRRWKRDSQRELRQLYPGDQVRLLDSTAGLGDHTINLAEEGFWVEACDESPVALAAARRAVQAAGLSERVEIFDARWQDLQRRERYDLVFNDALHWVYEVEELRRVLRGLKSALVPGGALVFFFADAQEPDEGAGLSVLEWDWDRIERVRVEWDHVLEGHRETLMVRAERGPDYIDEDHLYLVRDGENRAELDALTMRRVYRWDWHALSRLLTDVGFVDLRSERFDNVKGYSFAMNRAHRPVHNRGGAIA